MLFSGIGATAILLIMLIGEVVVKILFVASYKILLVVTLILSKVTLSSPDTL